MKRYPTCVFLSTTLLLANCGPAVREIEPTARVYQVGESMCFARDDVPEAVPACLPAEEIVRRAVQR